jgi:hypothetical protein
VSQHAWLTSSITLIAKGNWAQWLTPVILATQKAEIRKIVVQRQPGKIVHETLSGKTYHKKGLVEWLKV